MFWLFNFLSWIPAYAGMTVSFLDPGLRRDDDLFWIPAVARMTVSFLDPGLRRDDDLFWIPAPRLNHWGQAPRE
jgi:hypothetical protein